MATTSTLSEPALRVLAWLLDLAARRAGYTVLGQPGWAAAEEVERGARTWGTAELMRAQVRQGRVVQYDARAPGEVRGRWVYRIAQRGLDELALAVGIASAGVADPAAGEETGILIRESTQHVLSGLRAALNPGVKPRREWVPGQVGWRSSRELTAEMSREDEAAGCSDRWFTTEDLRWLVRLAFVEKKTVERTHVYRLLPAGEQLRAFEWKEPKGA